MGSLLKLISLKGKHIMKSFLFFIGLIAIVCSVHVEKDFGAFKAKYNKKYLTIPEDIYRQEVFEENVDYINQHNQEAEQGLHTFTLGLNEYADLSAKEWKIFYWEQMFTKPQNLPKFKMI